MRVAGVFSIKNGQEIIEKYHAPLISEVFEVIGAVRAVEHEFKVGHLKGATERKYDPTGIYKAFEKHFDSLRWKTLRVRCEYPTTNSIGYRKLDFVKGKLGVDVEFGKPLLKISSTCAKMTIFHNLGHIDCGIEIVPVKAFAEEMSTGVSYFEQFIWDLEKRGAADIDVPVMIIGIDA